MRAPHLLFALMPTVVALMIACKQTPLPMIDAGMASCIPSDTVALAGADLDRLRASPFLASLEGSAGDLAKWHASTSRVLVGWNGTSLLTIERGLFKMPPEGATAIDLGLAATGAPGRIASAEAQHRTGTTGAPGLIDYGSGIGARSAVWLAVRGGRALPLGGNLGNLNVLLQDADFAGAALELGEQATLRFGARGHTAESAAQLEVRLRGFLSLAQEAEIHRPEIARLIATARIVRTGRDVTATLSASPDAVAQLIAGFAR